MHTNSQDQPSSPAVPDINEMPYASRPENAPSVGFIHDQHESVSLQPRRYLTSKSSAPPEQGNAQLKHPTRIPKSQTKGYCIVLSALTFHHNSDVLI